MHNASCLHLLCGLWSAILTLLHLLQTYDHILKTQTCWPSASTLRSDAPTLWSTLQDLHNAACLQFRLCLFQTHHTHINRKKTSMMFFVSTRSISRSNLIFNIKVEQEHIVLERSVKLNLRPRTWRRIRNVFGKYSKNSLNFQFPHLLSQHVPKNPVEILTPWWEIVIWLHVFAIVANLAEGQLVQGWVQICASWNPDTIGGWKQQH